MQQVSGSSPRVRGSRLMVLIKINALGIIPAGAGLTGKYIAVSRNCRDHPRGCGAHTVSVLDKQAAGGSSPRVRGSLSVSSNTGSVTGIIPAGAGLTRLSSHSQSACRDHPRGCGAHRLLIFRILARRGSSPRVRGSRLAILADIARAGIIPAGAGLTISRAPATNSIRDHPRGCGAHLLDKFDFLDNQGSSPRVRGSLRHGRYRRVIFGIIPAGAGLTSARAISARAMRDHPRGCGAHYA